MQVTKQNTCGLLNIMAKLRTVKKTHRTRQAQKSLSGRILADYTKGKEMIINSFVHRVIGSKISVIFVGEGTNIQRRTPGSQKRDGIPVEFATGHPKIDTMQRITRYRAFHKTEKKMYEVVSITWSRINRGEIASVLICQEPLPAIRVRLDDVELMQTTGLQDKNGLEMFEGDIIELPQDARKAFDAVGSDGSGVAERAVIGFDDGSWMYGRTLGHPEIYNSYVWMVAQRDYENSFACEVIGDIYSNPELLKQV